MRQMLVLVDFDNYADFKLSDQYIRQWHIDNAVDALITHLLSWLNSKSGAGCFDEIVLRFYGGWYSGWDIEGAETDRKCMLDKYCHRVRRRMGGYRFKLSIADSVLSGQGGVLGYSLREYVRKLDVKSKYFESCLLGEGCVARVVKGWSESGCPGCGSAHLEILNCKYQKVVDTLMSCDVMYASYRCDYDAIGIVSGDYDMIPGVMYALFAGSRVVMFRKKVLLEYDSLIPECEIVPNVYFTR